MRGFADLVKSCWKIQKEKELSDKEMVELLEIVKARYQEKAREREHIEDLVKRTLITLNRGMGDKR